MVQVFDKYGVLKRPTILGVASWGSIIGTVTAQTDLISYLSSTYVPLTREITINGVTFDLSADRSWTISGATWGSITGTITAQTDLISYLNTNFYPLSNPNNYISRTGISGGTGISYNNTTGVITNSAPDQTVVLTNGSGISVTGTYPNFTITNTNPTSGISGTTNYSAKFTSPTTIGDGIMYDDGNRIGIGTTTPVSVLSITDQANLAYRGLTMSMHNNSRSGSLINFRKSRGTEASPVVVQSGDYTGLYFMYNYDGTTYRANGSFGYYVNGTVATNNIDGEWFWAASNAHDVDPYLSGNVRMILNSAGNLGVNTLTPTEKVHITGNIRVTGTYMDSINAAGTSGQVLSSTGTGTAWITPTASVGSVTGTVNRIVISGTSTAPIIDIGTDVVTLNGAQVLTNKTLTSPIFTGVASPTYTQGKLLYDTDNECLTFYNNDSNVSLQIGQEAWIRVKNMSGSTITNGSVVYINGSDSGLPTVALAKADSATTTIGAGLVTESIANGAIGYVTSLGAVNTIDTSAFSVGPVYISSTTAGALTQTAPTAPNYRYRVGFVTVVSATVGKIHVTPSTAALGNGTALQLLRINSAGTNQEWFTLSAADLPGAAKNGSINVNFDGMGSVVLVGSKAYVTMTKPGTITAWNVVANETSPNFTMDVWKVASGLPTVANTITAGSYPGITVPSTNYLRSTSLPGWTLTFAAGDVFGFNIVSCSVATFINSTLEVTYS